MFLTKPMMATLKQFRSSNVYDDEETESIDIKVVPYNVDMAINFGIVTIPEATGYFITKYENAKEGDQIIFNGHEYTIIKVADMWQFNKMVNMVLYVK